MKKEGPIKLNERYTFNMEVKVSTYEVKREDVTIRIGNAKETEKRVLLSTDAFMELAKEVDQYNKEQLKKDPENPIVLLKFVE